MPQPRALIPACLLHHDSQYREASGGAGLPCCLQGFGESLSPALPSTERLFLAPLLHLQLLPVLLRASPKLSLPCCWSSLGVFFSWGLLKPAHKAIEVDANSSAQQEPGTCGGAVMKFPLENLSLLSPSTPAGYGQRYPNHAAMSASRHCPSQKGSPPRSAVPGQGAGGAGGSGAAHSPSTSVTAHGVGGLLLPPPCLKLDAAEEADCKINYAFSKT